MKKRYRIDNFYYTDYVRNGRNYIEPNDNDTFSVMKPIKPIQRREYYIHDESGFYAGGFRNWKEARSHINQLTKRR